MSRDLEHQSLESTFSKVAELEFVDDEDDIRDSAFPNGEDAYDDESDSSDSSSEGSVDLGLADDLRESDSAMQCVLEMGGRCERFRRVKTACLRCILCQQKYNFI